MLKKITYPLQANNRNINIDELSKQFDCLCMLNSNCDANQHQHIYKNTLIAIGKTSELIVNEKDALKQLEAFCNAQKNNWMFGYLSYDLKNEIEQLHSNNNNKIEFPLLHFFVPEIVIDIDKQNITITYNDLFTNKDRAVAIYKTATEHSAKNNTTEGAAIKISSKITREQYINSVNKLKEHIAKGDIYEINFCQEFFSEQAHITPIDVYKKLNDISKAPFSAYYQSNNYYLLSSSPERFIKKMGNQLISQPIKGTAKRANDKNEDEQLKHELKNSEKERSENVMIVDLVRNDLSKVAQKGTVQVDELFGIYSFKQVHQMISTISCTLKEGATFIDIIKSTFPMGSMTGAPKHSAMQLIEKYENTKRGLYSGAVGYISPDGDFDFNVVIRSILYNANNNYLSFMVGSAITNKSEAESEYNECLLKAKAMFEVLQ
ncbi:MAG: aminodeoxychorismate synthase component I [Bacteroidia bacterium]